MHNKTLLCVFERIRKAEKDSCWTCLRGCLWSQNLKKSSFISMKGDKFLQKPILFREYLRGRVDTKVLSLDSKNMNPRNFANKKKLNIN